MKLKGDTVKDCIETVKALETLFSNNMYNGSGDCAFQIEKGSVSVMISAPHAVNGFREGKTKWADLFTGGIARYLHEVMGCHVIYSCKYTESDPNYDPPGMNKYHDELVKYLERHKVFLLMDIHGSTKAREYAVEMGTAPGRDPITNAVKDEDPSLKGYEFIDDVIKEIFEEQFKDYPIEQKSVWKNVIFPAEKQNTVTKYISSNTETACIQLEINGHYRDPENEELFAGLIEALVKIVEYFSKLDWNNCDSK